MDLIKQRFCFSRMRISQNVNLFCFFVFFVFFCDSIFFFSLSLFPCAFLFISSFVSHFIVFLQLEILAGFLSNKGRNLICNWVVSKKQNWQWIFSRNVACLIFFVFNCQNWSKFTKLVTVESSFLADFTNCHLKS